jgi:integrase
VALKNALMHHANINSYTQNLFNQVKCKSGSNQRERRFSVEETAQLFRTVNARSRTKKKEFKVTVLFALETACRIGEMLKLKWSEVNIEKREVRLLAHTTKTKKERKIPLTTVAQKILMWIQRHHNPMKRKDKRVFEFFSLDDHQLSRKFNELCEKAGIDDCRWHDMRHEATSRYYEKASSLTDMEIASITGHASLASLKRYAHLRPSSIIHKLW